MAEEHADLELHPLDIDDIRSNPNAPRDCDDEEVRGGRGEATSAIFSVAMGLKRKKIVSDPVRSPRKKIEEVPRPLSPSEMAILKWKRAARQALHMEDPWAMFHLERFKAERVRRYRYNALNKAWLEDEALVKTAPDPFGRGAMRECFRMKKLSSFAPAQNWAHASNYVAKRYLEPVDRTTYFDDVRLQMDAKLWAEEFNRHNPPKKVDIFQVSIIEFVERPGSPLYHMEHFIEGSYIKYNSNSGFISSQATRLTPQAFSHFTFERSGHELLVVDIQGVGDLYTDPQIHTAHGSDYGDGNLGVRGMALFFRSHTCNCVCTGLGLTPFDLAPSEKLVGPPASAIAQGAKTRLRGHEELCVGMSEYERSHLAEAFGPPKHRIRTYSSPPDFSHEHSTPPLLQQQDSGFRSLSSGSEDTLEDYSHDLELGSDSEDTETLQHQIANGHLPANGQQLNGGERPSAVPARLKRRQRYDSESSTIGDEHERAEFQRLVAQRARPSSVLDEVQLRLLARQQLGRHLHESQRSILGQIHLEMAKCHENGRFGDTMHPEGKYDQQAAAFHLEQAARCGILEALLVLSKVHLGLPHDLLEDWTLPETDENVSKGVEYLEQAARTGDRGSMIALAKALDSGQGLGSRKQRNWQEAVMWYNLAITTTENDEGGEYDGCMDDPPYLLLARQAELYLEGGHGLEKDAATAGELYQEAAAAATAAMKGRLANKYYQLAEEAQQEAC